MNYHQSLVAKCGFLSIYSFVALDLLWPISSGAQFRAVPKSPNKLVSPQPRPKAPTRYEQLLVRYLSRIDHVASESTRNVLQKYKENVALRRKYDALLVQEEGQWVEKLRNAAKTRKNKLIDFDVEAGHSLEFGALSPTSDASARIFSTLEQEGLVRREQLIPQVFGPAMSNGWGALLKQFVAEGKVERPERKMAVYQLYKSGQDREKLRPELTQMATQKGDHIALELLFFQVDPDTGRISPKITTENLSLYKQMGKSGFQPEMRIVCAQFATEIRDYETAQAICGELLNQKYKGISNVHAPAHEEDLALARARDNALQLMFYKIKNEWAFSTIYARSEENKDIVPVELAPKDSSGKPEASFRAYPLGDLEAGFAESLIREVSTWR